jgi:crotonobetainyl-CoA:carnitine CoA-transferase CaiB-like acyl-CoA transferase
VFADAEWRRFVDAISRPAWTRDPRFETVDGRVRHAAELDRRVAEWTRSRDAEETMGLLQEAGIAAGLVANAEDLCARDPQLAARGHFVDVTTPEGRTVRLDGPPYLLSETPAAVSGPGPLLGEHTDEVLTSLLGMTAEAIRALRADGVVA